MGAIVGAIVYEVAVGLHWPTDDELQKDSPDGKGPKSEGVMNEGLGKLYPLVFSLSSSPTDTTLPLTVVTKQLLNTTSCLIYTNELLKLEIIFIQVSYILLLIFISSELLETSHQIVTII